MSSEKHESIADTMVSAAEKSPKPEAFGTVCNINEKMLVRRIDYRIVPLMFFCYLMQFLDKVMINVSSLATRKSSSLLIQTLSMQT